VKYSPWRSQVGIFWCVFGTEKCNLSEGGTFVSVSQKLNLIEHIFFGISALA